MEKKSICIVVLGDIGRSPRMQYHAISLAEEGHKIDIVGYRGAQPVDSLVSKPLVSFHYLNPYPNLPLPRLINYIIKTIWQMISLLFVFCLIRTPDYLMVQNPPAVPTLLVCYIYKLLSKAKLIIDWHNYAHTIMALGVGNKSILVKITLMMETFFGKRADFNFCVTKEMKVNLQDKFGIKATTLYDRPPEMFKPISLKEKHDLLTRLGLQYKDFASTLDEGSAFTIIKNGEVNLRENRPALLISSTSWTEDEDFSLLLAALNDYEELCNENGDEYPNLICVITGKGPQKEYYIKKINALRLNHVSIITPWLEVNDYPLLLASADIGICLHTSSSGLDLPMKVVDMFGCGLPVCAYNFKCLNELVKHNINGFVFNDSKELFDQIRTLFLNFPNNTEQKEVVIKMKEELKTFQNLRWKENWKLVAEPIFK